jgi:RNA polymerase sigma factor (sigma-70 family)
LTKIEPIEAGRPPISVEVALDAPARSNRISLEPLVAAARSGDRDAFRVLVEPHLAVALGASTVLTGSAADAADAVQDALLSAWQGLGGLRDPEAFPAWFRRHVIRAAARSNRTRARGRIVELDASLATAGDDLDRVVEGRTLARAFERLDDADRLLLILHHVWRLPVNETAEFLRVPEGTVKSRVHYAMQRLRAGYDAEDRR